MAVEHMLLAEPRGYCAGVEMAIKALTWMVRIFEPPVYCYHDIVHNRWVVEAFERAGVVFIDDIAEVPHGAPVMLSAHGSAPEVVSGAAERAAVVIDAVCPLVTKVHHEVRRMADKGFDIIYVGHAGHDEAIGTVAEAPGAITLVEPEWDLAERFDAADDGKVALVAQTTLGVHEWQGILDTAKASYPDLWTARRGDLCYATTNRQAAVIALAEQSDVVLVVGSDSSSNTKALVRVCLEHGTPAHRIDGPDGIDPAWLSEARTVGLTAGASAPDHLVEEVIAAVAPSGGVHLMSVIEEDEYFPLPPELRRMLGVLGDLVTAGFGGGPTSIVEDDRSFTATEALAAITG
jgi:4-hydroxy-3-methylbut-2-enyl diphosphate reductase